MKRPGSRAGRVAPALVATVLLAAACAPDPPAAIVGVRAQGCGISTGSGAFVADGLVLTAAHTVAGATSIVVTTDGAEHPAELVRLDADLDLAALRTDGPAGRPLTLASSTPEAGTAAVAYAVRAGEVVPIPVTIVRPVTIDTTDIYLEGSVSRPGLELAGDVGPGDSGAAVVAGGRVVGVVWARSSLAPGRAWAVIPSAVDLASSPGVSDDTRCAG